MASPYVAACCQIAPVYKDKEATLRKMADAARRAVQARPETRLLVFPECATTGYIPYRTSVEDTEAIRAFHALAEPREGPTAETLGKLAEELGVFLVTGFLEADPKLRGVAYNAALLLDPEGNVLACHRKVHNPLMEKDYFKAGSDMSVLPTAIGRLSFSICYDLWFPEMIRLQALEGTEVHINCTANLEKFLLGSTVLPVARAVENGMFVVQCNRVGSDTDQIGPFGGHSSIVAPLGEVLAEAGGGEETIFATIDLSQIDQVRATISMFKDRQDHLYRLERRTES